jgi:two-component system response regulator YesN
MLKVLIADDEYLVREMLKSAIDWHDHGWEIIGEAENGKQVLSQLAHSAPDLVIIDINMPIVNGIEVAKEIYTHYPQMHMIIVSGYSDFEYARQALTYKVTDYLLKPIDDHALLEAVLRVNRELESRAQTTQKLKQWDETKNVLQAERFAHFISLWLDASLSAEQIAANLDDFQVNLPADYIQCAGIELRSLASSSSNSTDEYLSQVLEFGRQSLRKAGLPWHVLHSTDSRTLTIVIGSTHAFERFLPAALEEWARMTHSRLSISLTIGISETSSGYNSLPKLYESSKQQLSRKFYVGHGSLIRPSIGSRAQDTRQTYLAFPREKLAFLIRSGQTANLRSILKDYYTMLADEQSYTREAALLFSSELLNLEAHKLVQKQLTSDFIHQTETLAELGELIIGILTELSVSYYQEQFTKKDELVQQSQYLIIEALNDPDLSVELLSQKLFVSASYLSHRFKKVQGVGLNEYINTLRMRKAVELLSEQDYKLHELAEKIGYRDPIYFSKCFKKMFQVSFSEYKRAK